MPFMIHNHNFYCATDDCVRCLLVEVMWWWMLPLVRWCVAFQEFSLDWCVYCWQEVQRCSPQNWLRTAEGTPSADHSCLIRWLRQCVSQSVTQSLTQSVNLIRMRRELLKKKKSHKNKLIGYAVIFPGLIVLFVHLDLVAEHEHFDFWEFQFVFHNSIYECDGNTTPLNPIQQSAQI